MFLSTSWKNNKIFLFLHVVIFHLHKVKNISPIHFIFRKSENLYWFIFLPKSKNYYKKKFGKYFWYIFGFMWFHFCNVEKISSIPFISTMRVEKISKWFLTFSYFFGFFSIMYKIFCQYIVLSQIWENLEKPIVSFSQSKKH